LGHSVIGYNRMRTFSVVLFAAASVAGAQTSKVSTQGSVAKTSRELLPEEQIQQVLSRLTFGPRPNDATKVRAMGVDQWIDAQLHPEKIDDPIADKLASSYSIYKTPTPDIVRDYTALQQLQRRAARTAAMDSMEKRDARRELIADDPKLIEIRQKSQQLVGQLQSAKLARALTSERQLDEVMVDFWLNHFSVFAGKGQTRLYLADYEQDVIRPHSLGKFRDLLGAVAKSPAMLFYLDNFQSAADSMHPTLAARNARAGGRGGSIVRGVPGRRPLPGLAGRGQLPPALRDRLQNATPEERERLLQRAQQQAKRGLNENYARELMELHTLGVDGGYTQKDVQEVARALTGWTFNRQDGEFVFNPNVHDAGEKLILGRRFPAGRGIEEGEEVLDILARAPQTARFISTKLARHFVSDEPPKELVDRCAGTFSKTDGDIRETVRCVVTSPEFFSRSAYRAKVKTPFEVVASALRAVGAQPDTTPRTAQVVARLGQPIFGRQTPDGWPDRADAWMNTGAILNRINFGLSLAAGQLPGARLASWEPYESIRALSRAQQVDSVVKYVLGGKVSSDTRQVLMTGENPMLSNAANDANPDSNLPMMDGRGLARQNAKDAGGKGFPRGRGAALPGFGRPVDLKGLSQVVGLALGAPEFQRR
jgi:uncharacterized protein (DUF1800 family)